ncbi:unnamed protein product [Urochloa humidicola]
MVNPSRPVSILTWNVRGLGDKSKCSNVRLAFPTASPTIACLQETKLQAIDQFKAATFLPHRLASSFAFQPSVGASGGVLTAWDPSMLQLTSSTAHRFSLTTTLAATSTNLAFTVTNCYGPCEDSLKAEFLLELALVEASVQGPWLLLGDFNMIRLPEERSNGNFDQAKAAMFNDAKGPLVQLELPLLDRLFTWSNHQEVPILVKLDRFFVNNHWSACLPNLLVTSSSAQTSDHCQLFLNASSSIPKPAIFRFNNH